MDTVGLLGLLFTVIGIGTTLIISGLLAIPKFSLRGRQYVACTAIILGALFIGMFVRLYMPYLW